MIPEIINYILIEAHKDAWLTLIGVGVVALVVIIGILFMKWESKRATNIWKKRK